MMTGIIGFVLGEIAGVILMGLCVAAGRSDEERGLKGDGDE